jgi:hypothetical protein
MLSAMRVRVSPGSISAIFSVKQLQKALLSSALLQEASMTSRSDLAQLARNTAVVSRAEITRCLLKRLLRMVCDVRFPSMTVQA